MHLLIYWSSGEYVDIPERSFLKDQLCNVILNDLFLCLINNASVDILLKC